MSIRESNSYRVLQQGNTNAERTKNSLITSINRNFQNNPSYIELLRNDAETVGVILTDNSTSPTAKLDNVKSIIMQPTDILNIGDVFDYNNSKWITVTSEMFSDIYYKGTLQKSNNTLSFYNSQTLYTLPIIISAVGNSLGLSTDENTYLTDLSDFIIIRVPKNSTSQLIDINQVFKIGKRNWKITNDSDIVENGLLIFKMEVTLEEVVIPIYSYAIEILNGIEQTIRSGETLTLNVQVEDNGIVVTPTPALLYETSDSTVCTVNNSGIVLVTAISGNAIITVKLVSDNTIMNTIKIIATSESQINYNYTLIGNLQPDTQISYNQTRSFTATKYDSLNNIIPTQFLFQVVGNTPVDKYLLTVLNNIQCTVKALGYPYTITLRAVDINSNQYIDKPITLKSLI